LNAIIKHLKKAERELEIKAHKIGKDLDGLRKALLALGHKTANSVKPKKRRLSKQAKAAMAAAQQRRWAAVRAVNAGKNAAIRAGKRMREEFRKKS
jgi:hypothetical protein